MKYCYSLAAVVLFSAHLACGGVISVVPGTDQSLPINSPVNLTFSCNVSEDESNSAQRQAIWEVQDRQIQGGQNRVRDAFENIGIFIVEVEVELGVVDLVVSSAARMQFQASGLMVRCTAFTIDPPITQLGETLFVRTYGRPEAPGNLRLMPSRPALLLWNRPTNIPVDVLVNYTITINSTSSDSEDGDVLSNQTQFSIQRLEMEFAAAEDCEPFSFHVVARVAFAEDSMTAVVMDTVPLSTNVSAIEESLRVDFVTISNGGSVASRVSFMAVETCSRNFPIRNYTVLIEGIGGPTIMAVPTVTMVTGTLNSSDYPFLVSGRMFQVGVMACSEVTCRTSDTIPLNTSDVQRGRAVFFENNVFLTCSFAGGSEALGCVFVFQVNQNGTGTEEFVVLQSMSSRQCNVTGNQMNGYTDLFVFDLMSGGIGQVALAVDATPVSSEADFTAMTGCTVPQEVDVVQVPDSKAVAIAVPIVVVLLLIAVVVVVVTVLLVYRELYRKKPKLAESDSPDTLFLDIASDNYKLLKNSPLTRRSTVPVMRSLPASSHPMAFNPHASLPLSTAHSTLNFSVPSTRAAPIEVELHRDSIKLKVNKTALRAVARFQYMAKRHAQSNEGSLTSEEEQSLLAMSNISRVHMTDEFKSLCCDLPPVEEGGEEEEELKSWGIINTPPPLSPPHK